MHEFDFSVPLFVIRDRGTRIVILKLHALHLMCIIIYFHAFRCVIYMLN